MDFYDICSNDKKLLTGVDVYDTSVVFELDGIPYMITEDESDGYRSYMKDFELSQVPIQKPFPACEVICALRGGYNSDILEITNARTKALILAVGTDNKDDYYPYYVCDYRPGSITEDEPVVNDPILIYTQKDLESTSKAIKKTAKASKGKKKPVVTATQKRSWLVEVDAESLSVDLARSRKAIDDSMMIPSRLMKKDENNDGSLKYAKNIITESLAGTFAMIITNWCENLAELGCPRDAEPDIWFREMNPKSRLAIIKKLLKIIDRD